MLGTCHKAAVLFFLAALIPTVSLGAQNSAPREGGKKTYVIEDITFHISGMTWDRMLAKKIEIRQGKTFSSPEDLEAYLADRRQVLINQRVLAHGEIKYTTSEKPDGSTAVHVEVYAEDTWNIFVLPYFKYDSNSGFLLSLRARDFNFLGSMETLKLDLDYILPGTGPDANELGMQLGFVLPFRLVDHDWRFGLEQSLVYNADSDDYEFKIVSSLAIDFPILLQDWTLQFSQGYFYNDTDAYGDTSYHQSKVSFGTDFELPFDIGRLGPLKYGPDVFTQVKYRPGRDLSEERRGVEPGFTHELFAERIDWFGNFRDGAKFSVGNTYIYNLDAAEWRNSINWNVVGHKAFSWVGLSARLSGFFQLDKELGVQDDDNVGEPIRGILDDRLIGDAGIFLNTDILVKMWLWKLDRFFEVQVGPFFDFGLVKRKGESFYLDEMWYGGGMQMLVFPRFARSLYLRASLGFDLEAVLEDHRLTGTAPRDDKKRWEMFIGLGHHY